MAENTLIEKISSLLTMVANATSGSDNIVDLTSSGTHSGNVINIANSGSGLDISSNNWSMSNRSNLTYDLSQVTLDSAVIDNEAVWGNVSECTFGLKDAAQNITALRLIADGGNWHKGFYIQTNGTQSADAGAAGYINRTNQTGPTLLVGGGKYCIKANPNGVSPGNLDAAGMYIRGGAGGGINRGVTLVTAQNGAMQLAQLTTELADYPTPVNDTPFINMDVEYLFGCQFLKLNIDSSSSTFTTTPFTKTANEVFDIDWNYHPQANNQINQNGIMNVNMSMTPGSFTGVEWQGYIIKATLDYINKPAYELTLESNNTGAGFALNNKGTGDSIFIEDNGTERFVVNDDGETKIRVYSQTAEPTLTEDDHMAIWIDTDDSNKVYLVYRRGTGDQVKLTFT